MSSFFRSLFHGNSKHRKLSEDGASTRESVMEGVTYYCKYLGNTAITEPKGADNTASAIEKIMLTATREARKPDRVGLRVGQQGIHMSDAVSGGVMLETSIYRISYCSTDVHHDHVFAFIASDDEDHCVCHAFLCPKKKMAQTVTLTIAQAFNLAYEGWKKSQKNNEIVGHEGVPAQVMMSPAVEDKFGTGSCNQAHTTPSSWSTSIPIRAHLGSSGSKSNSYQSSQMLQSDLDKACNFEQDVHSSRTHSTSSTPHKDSDKETIHDKTLKGVLNVQRLLGHGLKGQGFSAARDIPRRIGRPLSCSIQGSPSSFSEQEFLLSVS
ncbi:ankyrin repeat and sterile alpha motif domain-containing protein 1B-like [Oratosquilla oratoria]|uniref:ankyrin repeat and sterile alpha motif domain-containing protein 1B-like n=1 Tax=Oratosquilla oratoria TaxID=337810 RepID=UPI003F76A3CA